MRKHYLFTFFVMLLFCKTAFSQSHLQLGYGVSYMNPQEMNRVIYIYNQLHYNLDKPMPKVHFGHGYTVGFSFGKETKFEIHRTSRRVSVVAEQGDTIREFRFINNSMNFGAALSPSKNWDLGGSFDIGTFKGQGYRGPKNGKREYTKLFVTEPSIFPKIQLGFSVFVQHNFLKGFMGLRLYYQLQFMKLSLSQMDSWMLGGPIVHLDHLNDKASSLGLELMFRIGKMNRN